jgi:hypothetical protein
MNSKRRGYTFGSTDYQPGFIVNQYGDNNQTNVVRRDRIPHYRYQDSQVQVDQNVMTTQMQYNSTQGY